MKNIKRLIPFTICMCAIFLLQACTAGSLQKEYKEDYVALESLCDKTCRDYGTYYTQVYTPDLEKWVCVCRTESPYRQVRYRIK